MDSWSLCEHSESVPQEGEGTGELRQRVVRPQGLPGGRFHKRVAFGSTQQTLPVPERSYGRYARVREIGCGKGRMHD
jgi:hypothetical protein